MSADATDPTAARPAPPAPGEPARAGLTWDAFGDACRTLAQAIADDGRVPDVVVAVARGGLTVAGAQRSAADGSSR